MRLNYRPFHATRVTSARFRTGRALRIGGYDASRFALVLVDDSDVKNAFLKVWEALWALLAGGAAGFLAGKKSGTEGGVSAGATSGAIVAEIIYREKERNGG